MKIGDRVKEVRTSLKKTQVEFAHALGVSLTAVQSYEGNKSIPGGEVIRSFINLGISPMWLLTGEGPMRLEEQYVYVPFHGKPQPEEGQKPEMVYVPHYNVAASAGQGNTVEHEEITDLLAFNAPWVKKRGFDKKYLLAIDVTGDSMEPTLSEGDTVLVDNRVNRIRDNAIYALGLGDDILVKRVVLHFDGSVTIKSDNSFYGEETLPPEKVSKLRVVGRVVWISRPM